MHKILISLAAAGAMAIIPLAGHAATLPTRPAPFKVTWSGTAVTLGTSSYFVGKGTASYVGTVTSNGRADVTGVDNSTCIGGVANVNQETFTDLKDDSLTITSQDVACPTGAAQFHGRGHWVITGGSGIFTGATGSGLFDGHSDFVAGTFAATLSGTISFRHA